MQMPFFDYVHTKYLFKILETEGGVVINQQTEDFSTVCMNIFVSSSTYKTKIYLKFKK